MTDREQLVAERTVTMMLTRFLIGLTGELASQYEDPLGAADDEIAVWLELIAGIREPADAHLLEGIDPGQVVAMAQARSRAVVRSVREGTSAVLALREAGEPN